MRDFCFEESLARSSFDRLALSLHRNDRLVSNKRFRLFASLTFRIAVSDGYKLIRSGMPRGNLLVK